MKKIKKLLPVTIVVAMVLSMLVTKQLSASSYKFRENKYSRRPGQSIGKIVKKWDLSEVSRKGSCISANGEDVIYYRKGLKVKATSKTKKGMEYITEIRITSDEFSTSEGISVGDEFDDIESSYDKIERQGYTGNIYYVKKGKTKIIFSLDKDDIINAIYYREKS